MRVKISQWILSRSIINYLGASYKEVVNSVFLEVFRKKQYFSKEGSKAYFREISKASVHRKSEEIITSQHMTLKAMRTIFLSVVRVLLSSPLFILWLYYLKSRQCTQMSECSEQLPWLFVWGDTIPCLALKLGKRVWSGRGVGRRLSMMKSSWCSKEKSTPRTLLGGHWETRHHEYC